MATNTFREVYRSFSNLQLYEILQNKPDYQPVAIEAALAEWESRRLSAEDINAVQEEWNTRLASYQQKIEKQTVLKNNVKKYGNRLIDDFDPLKSTSTDRNIRMICVGVGLVLLYHFSREFALLKFILINPSVNEIPYLLNELPSLLAIPATWKFWNKKKIGWALLCGWIVYSLISLFFALLLAVQHVGKDSDFILPQPDIFGLVVSTGVFTGLLLYINKKEIRTSFNLSGNYLFNVILATVIISICLFVLAVFA